MAKANKTTVSLDEKTKNQLSKFGQKGESYDTILSRVMNKAGRFCGKELEDEVAVGENQEEEQE